jgi:hypothetical protein
VPRRRPASASPSPTPPSSSPSSCCNDRQNPPTPSRAFSLQAGTFWRSPVRGCPARPAR